MRNRACFFSIDRRHAGAVRGSGVLTVAFSERCPMESDLLCNAHGIRDIDELMDAEARFRALFDATYPAVVRFVRHRGLVGHDGEDLIAATYEVAWRRL